MQNSLFRLARWFPAALGILFVLSIAPSVADAAPTPTKQVTKSKLKPIAKKLNFKLTPAAQRNARTFLKITPKTKSALSRLATSLGRVQSAHLDFSKHPKSKVSAKRLALAIKRAGTIAALVGKLTRAKGKQGQNTDPTGDDDEQGPNSGSRVVHALAISLSADLQGASSQLRNAGRKTLAVGEQSALGTRISAISGRRSDLFGLLEPVTSR